MNVFNKATNVFNKATTENTFTYYYNPTLDLFVSKMKFLELDGKADMIVVDDILSAQQIDEIFADIYSDR